MEIILHSLYFIYRTKILFYNKIIYHFYITSYNFFFDMCSLFENLEIITYITKCNIISYYLFFFTNYTIHFTCYKYKTQTIIKKIYIPSNKFYFNDMSPVDLLSIYYDIIHHIIR